MEKDINNLKELKEFLETLTDKQLQQPILSAVDEDACFEISNAWILEEDHINPSGDGMEPISAYKDEPEVLEDEHIVLRKDAVVFYGFSKAYLKQIEKP